MGVEKIVTKPGNGTDFPKKHDEICVDYTGWLYDEDAPDNKGTQFDTSLGRGVLTTMIGAGRVIKGWDEGILGSEDVPPMSLGEVAILKITPDYAYGSRLRPEKWSLLAMNEAMDHSCVSNEHITATTGLARYGCQQLLTYHSELTADHPEHSGFLGHIPADATLIFSPPVPLPMSANTAGPQERRIRKD
ncbi:uncharacterized protein yc1106_01952 [Curvularia clavata]|uniref:peptidylprolyl isomerase n=1 Tax=Curvularia clavata TaxID=95742 RepID=A0A9Q9DP23_CURCL|nr:uncharacterized protein yc1106_01952 [Curvularia clavata]